MFLPSAKKINRTRTAIAKVATRIGLPSKSIWGLAGINHSCKMSWADESVLPGVQASDSMVGILPENRKPACLGPSYLHSGA
jgi:hypothetical protein